MKALSFDDITLIPRFNDIKSRSDVDTSIKLGGLKCDIPVISSNMDTITGHKMAHQMRLMGGMGCLHRFCSIEDNIDMYYKATILELGTIYPHREQFDCIVSIGVNEGLDRFQALYEVGARYFCIDVAHGHSRAVGHLIKQIREFSNDVYIIAGNVCTAEGAEYLADKGANAIKVGIGPGSVCTTRLQTGFGVPQFTAIQECRHVNCFIIADGGIRTPGDAVKAFVAGADAIMLGGMLAGTDETPGDIVDDGPGHGRFKIFRGMASKEAQDDFMGSMAEWKTAEGIEIRVKTKGPVANVVSNLMGGIRSGMTYCGANTISQIRQRARWIEVSAAGAAEGRPHGQERL